jgi:ABC-type branched-subunit amino acid transport system substrate-binding protein
MNGAIELAVRQRPSPSTIAIVSCDDPAAIEDAAAALSLARARDLQVVVPARRWATTYVSDGITVYPHLRSEFESLASELQNLSPDILIVAGHLAECESLVRAAARTTLAPRYFALSAGPSLPPFIAAMDHCGIAAVNLIEPKQWSAAMASPEHCTIHSVRDFSNLFQRLMGMPPTSFSAGAAACGAVYAESFRRAMSLEHGRVRDALRSIRGEHGLDTHFGRVAF